MAKHQSSPQSASSQGANSQDANHTLEPFFVLHKAQLQATVVEKVSKSRKGRKKGIESSPKSPEKSKRTTSDEQPSNTLYEQWRFKAFNEIWSLIQSSIEGVLRDINLKLFNEVLQWIEDSFSEIKSNVKLSSSEILQPYPLLADTLCRKIPTAFVLTKNAEFVDDIQTFCDLGSHLKANRCHVANMSALDFSLKFGIGGSVRSLLRQLHSEPLDGKIADMLTLAKWYCEEENNDKPIVVMIDDMECCNADVLGNFITMLSEWVMKIPIFFIMGVATTIEAPKNMLPSDALQHLNPCKLTLGTPSDRMNSLVESVLVKVCYCFSLGHEVSVFLRNYFLRHDGTITSFISALKLACSKHFSLESVSFLGLYMLDQDSEERWSEKFVYLPESMKRCVLNLHSCKSEKNLQGGVGSIVQQLSDLKASQRFWSSVVLCLFEVARYSKMQFLDIFCEATDPKMYCMNGSENSLKKHFRCGDKNSTARSSSGVGSITRVIHTIREMPVAALSNLLDKWNNHTEEMTEINEEVKKLQSVLASVDEGKVYEENLHNIRNRKSVSVISGKGNSANEKVAMLLDAMIRKYMKPLECMTLHEIICFRDVDVLQSGLIGDPRKTIQLDLLKCHSSLSCSCCSSDAKNLSPSMHDTSIMYKLAQEFGDVINLYEWYQSFKTVLTSSSQTSRKKGRPSPASKKAKPLPPSETEALIQARFCGAVTELQISGLLRMPTKRRPDFIQRIAFGL
ncbi:Origin recognition complex subunit 3 [Rhynchospora pubera]|uniref:Origin recognition complex subunit 3 n=1 Tax=Rhynchospora pubera TaxID=906938 RepID=A0AAV8DWF8_9POAL|nr:Origin recognition complex subunit 3 [Rhynchospora pubera]